MMRSTELPSWPPTPVPQEQDAAALFKAVYDSFKRAAKEVDASFTYNYLLGDCSIELSFASPTLAAKITPAFAHRLALPALPALTICLWDSASTGVELPPWVSGLVRAAQEHWVGILGPRGELEKYNAGHMRAAYLLGPEILCVLDLERNLAVYWVQDAAQVPYYESSSPLKTILNWWMSEHGRQFVHAGAVGTPDGGILLAGKGGSGKSSTVLACLGSPLKIVSDDYALVAPEPEPYVFSLYNTAKLTGQADLERFPQLVSRIHNLDRLDEEKLVIFLREHYAEQLRAGFPIRAVMVPRVTGKPDTTIQPMAPGAALAALAATTLFQLPGSGGSALQAMASVVRRVPRYELLLGTDVAQIPQVLLNGLSRL